MNLLIGILCEVVTAVSKNERNEAAINYIKSTILMTLIKHDEDNSGAISNEELAKVLEEPSTARALHELDIDLAYLSEFKDLLFDDVNKEIPIGRAVEMFMLCRGEEVASVTTIAHQYSLIRMLLQREVSDLKILIKSELSLFKRRGATARLGREASQKIRAGTTNGSDYPAPECPNHMTTSIAL